MLVEKFEDYDEEDKLTWICYFLNNKEDLGEFIAKVKPHRIDLNSIPIKKWFVYFCDDSGDSTYDSIILLDKYIDEQTNHLLEVSRRVSKLKAIYNLNR